MKLKSLILSFALTLFAVSGVWAQDKPEKYEYAQLANNITYLVFITADKEESIPTKLKENSKDFLKKLNELTEQGWELYSTPNGGLVYLRKKKN